MDRKKQDVEDVGGEELNRQRVIGHDASGRTFGTASAKGVSAKSSRAMKDTPAQTVGGSSLDQTVDQSYRAFPEIPRNPPGEPKEFGDTSVSAGSSGGHVNQSGIGSGTA